MGIQALCSVTVVITAIEGVVQDPFITVFANVEFPTDNGMVTFDVFGETITAPCPTAGVQEQITVLGIGLVDLLITTEHVVV